MSATPKKPEEAAEPTPPEQPEGYTPEEEEEVQKRLEDLGYI
jgi:hypothetical protein